jgi:hypothetical protein
MENVAGGGGMCGGEGGTPKLEEMKDGAVLGTAARHWRDGWEVSRLSHKLNVT